MADYGLKITAAGKDITSTEPTDYIFNSAYGSVKVVTESVNKTYETLTVNASSSATATITHGLSFVPLAMLFTELRPGSGKWYGGGLPWPDPTDIAAGCVTPDATLDSLTYVDSTNLKITYVNGTGSQKIVKYYYFIFADNGS